MMIKTNSKDSRRPLKVYNERLKSRTRTTEMENPEIVKVAEATMKESLAIIAVFCAFGFMAQVGAMFVIRLT